MKQENCCTPTGQIKRYKDCIGCDKKPKQEMAGKAFYESADKVIVVKRQETLEEVAERIFPKEKYPTSFETLRKAFISNAKYQAERMYSEEEVIELLTQRSKHFGTNVKPFQELLLKQDLEWFEKFKKK